MGERGCARRLGGCLLLWLSTTNIASIFVAIRGNASSRYREGPADSSAAQIHANLNIWTFRLKTGLDYLSSNRALTRAFTWSGLDKQ